MSISLIAAVGKNRELGKAGDLIWRIPADLKFFRDTTTGSTVLMGRKTFESLPSVLPNRKNVVLTSNPDYQVPDGVQVITSLDEIDDTDIFVIGGGKVYAEILPLASKIYLTEIDASDADADAFFPEFDKSKYDKIVIGKGEYHDLTYSHVLYTKK